MKNNKPAVVSNESGYPLIKVKKRKNISSKRDKIKVSCKKCHKLITNSDYSILCVDCHQWIHRVCAKMTVKEIKSWASWEWHCGGCSTSCKKIVDEHTTKTNSTFPEKNEGRLPITLTISEKEMLQKAYFTVNGPSSFGSVDNLMKRTGISRSKVEYFLSTSRTYTKFRMAHRRKNFQRLKTISLHIDEIWSADLAYMDKLSSTNDGVKYLFVAVDTLSRMLYVQPMKNKTAKETKLVFSKIVCPQKKPKKLWVDDGTEFKGEFKHFCDANDINIYSTHSEKKSAFAERNIRSLKSLIYKYLHEYETTRYIDCLQDFVSVINCRVNRMIGMSPIQVRKTDEPRLTSLCNTNEVKKPKFKIGDTVRLSKENLTFMKGYKQQFTDEIFTIVDIYTVNPPTYILQDAKLETILGKFYEPEMIKYISNA